MLHTQWNTGYEIGFFFVLIIGAGCLLTILIGVGAEIAFRNRSGGPDGLGWITAGIATVIGLIVGGIAAFVFFPYQSVYFKYQPISGTITQQVSSRFINEGSQGGTTQNFLVYINGNPYRCDDTRCSGLQKGMKVTLMCEKQYQFNATAGWSCNWGKLGLNS